MEVIDRYETAKRINGRFQFYRVKFIVKDGDEYYIGKWKDRKQAPQTLTDLEDLKPIPTKDRGPAIRPHWAICSTDSPSYLKKPGLEEYLDTELETRIRREIETCELIKQSPHPNLAVYHGCIAAQGRAVGLSFKKYQKTLVEEVDPQRLAKNLFVTSGRPLVHDYMRCWLRDLESALRHLYSLGLVHNDLTPANIMLDENQTPFIIDFGSICRVGESLQHTKRTHGWHDEAITHAVEENDLDALRELETWLFGSVDDFKFT